MRIVIPGEPIAKARHRCACRGGKPVAYDSQAILACQKRTLLASLIEEIPENDRNAVIGAYLDVRVSFYLTVPVSATKSRQMAKFWNLENPSSVDLDNLIKWLDIGNGILWHDDRQIVNLSATMRYSETPCTIIEIKPIKISMDENEKKVAKIFTPNELELLRDRVKLLADTMECSVFTEEPKACLEKCSFELIAFANYYSQKFSKLAKS